MKSKEVKIILSIVILIIIIATGIFFIINYNKKYREIAKKEDQAITEATQLTSEDTNSKTEQQNEIDEKMKSILVGILKYSGEIEEKYESEEVDRIINDFNQHKGIFISNRAKDKVIKLLKETTSVDYTIDSDGYLKNNDNKETNNISKEINKLIKGNKKIIIGYNPYYYCKLGEDICTFNIDETVYMQKFKQDDTIIMILNPVKYEQEYESKNDLINQIINNVNN